MSKHLIPKNPTLESATGGYSWKLKIERVGGSYCFTHGWSKVVEDAHLGYADLLVFKLIDQSTFKVSILSPNGCERFLPYPIIKSEDDGVVYVSSSHEDGDPFFTTTISKTHKHILVRFMKIL